MLRYNYSISHALTLESAGIFFVNLSVAKLAKYHIYVEIDKLTNSIINTISGDSFLTDIKEVSRTNLKTATKKNGWNFNWLTEFKMKDRKVS
jgi:hypothetical protein